jgi:hypothetical protein
MANLLRASTIIENNWKNVKYVMRKSWSRLTVNDVNNINDYTDLLSKLQEAYQISEVEAIEVVDDFIDKMSLDPDLSRLQELTEAFCGATYECTKKSRLRSMSRAQEKTALIYGDMTHFAVENPLKVLGLGILAPVAIKKIVQQAM